MAAKITIIIPPSLSQGTSISETFPAAPVFLERVYPMYVPTLSERYSSQLRVESRPLVPEKSRALLCGGEPSIPDLILIESGLIGSPPSKNQPLSECMLQRAFPPCSEQQSSPLALPLESHERVALSRSICDRFQVHLWHEDKTLA